MSKTQGGPELAKFQLRGDRTSGEGVPGTGSLRFLKIKREMSMPDSSEDFARITVPYLLVLNIPYFVDASGRVLLERAWHHDLVQHLHYLRVLALAAPRRPLPADTTQLVPIEEGLRERLGLVPLPPQTSRIRAIAELPRIFWALWRAIGQAEIVHTGVGGWPLPLGWLRKSYRQAPAQEAPDRRGECAVDVSGEKSQRRTPAKESGGQPLRANVEILLPPSRPVLLYAARVSRTIPCEWERASSSCARHLGER